jgi:hypothetical protein
MRLSLVRSHANALRSEEGRLRVVIGLLDRSGLDGPSRVLEEIRLGLLSHSEQGLDRVGPGLAEGSWQADMADPRA